MFEKFIHNNFGWGGDSNGWYNAGIFNAGVGPSFSSDHFETKGQKYNFQYDIWLITSIY